jgi:BirA family transcriptional regulator, biotin operon repressor / biotin---[acetyl-CoA-carboxylase] ligase
MSSRKRTVIDILRANPDFVSGEAISGTLGISRNAVHKHVNSLRSRGYRILGVSHRGYKLEEEPCRLSIPLVTSMTRQTLFGRALRYHDEIESTNAEAKSLAADGAPEGTVVIAECQTAGRGRLGRRWTSPAGKGLLFSVILRPALPMSDAHLLTLVAATAAAEAIETQTGVAVRIKWPNDLYVDDRKLGGILTEVSGEQDEIDWVVVGIGLNVNTEYGELPVPLRRTAASLKMAGGQLFDRSELLARILLSLEASYVATLRSGFGSALESFRGRDYLSRKTVSVQTREGPVVGEALGIDDRGALLLQLPHRHVRRFYSGDVTLHP